MSKKNTLLEENTVRRFMTLANIGGLTDGHISRRDNLHEMGGMYDEDLYEQEGDEEEDPTAGMEPEGEEADLGAPEGDDMAMDPEPELGGEEEGEMGLGAEEPAEGGDAATTIVDAAVSGLEKGLKAAGLLGDDDSLTTSDGPDAGDDMMGDPEMDAEAPALDDMSPEAGDEEAPMDAGAEMGGEEGEEDEDLAPMEENALNEIAKRVAQRLLQRRSGRS